MAISTVCISIQEFEELMADHRKMLEIRLECRQHERKKKRIMTSAMTLENKLQYMELENARTIGRIKGTVYES